ncbi:hypothetical protein IG631_23358 [Alternaria alternata]|nr:hypothetical protein IG631_23358 [Alternaria alternata]
MRLDRPIEVNRAEAVLARFIGDGSRPARFHHPRICFESHDYDGVTVGELFNVPSRVNDCWLAMVVVIRKHLSLSRISIHSTAIVPSTRKTWHLTWLFRQSNRRSGLVRSRISKTKNPGSRYYYSITLHLRKHVQKANPEHSSDTSHGVNYSAGVFLPQQFRVFHAGGRIFRDLAVRTQQGKPTCAVVFGSSTAGGAYHPALSDYTIFVEDQAQVFLGGPPLVKMATGEVVTAEELGGAKVHATVTGLADQIAVDE